MMKGPRRTCEDGDLIFGGVLHYTWPSTVVALRKGAPRASLYTVECNQS